MEANSEEDNHSKSMMNSNEGQSKPKRQMKTPFPLETLEKADASARDTSIHIFSKSLSKSDIEGRLSVPLRSLKHFSIPDGEHSVCFTAVDRSQRSWSFNLSIRPGGHPKPVISGDWASYVKAIRGKVGDVVWFNKHIDAAGGVQFNIAVKRRFYNFLSKDAITTGTSQFCGS